MVAPPAGVRVFLACGYTDMRRYAECWVMRSSTPGMRGFVLNIRLLSQNHQPLQSA